MIRIFCDEEDRGGGGGGIGHSSKLIAIPSLLKMVEPSKDIPNFFLQIIVHQF